MRVSVIGGSSVPAETAAVAEELGERLANRGHTVVCGGLGGVMAAVCRGAANAGGETIGVLPTGRVRTRTRTSRPRSRPEWATPATRSW